MMASYRSAICLFALVLLPSPDAHSKPKKIPYKPPPTGIPTHFFIGHIDVIFRRNAALVTTDLVFTRGSFHLENLDVFLAYGAPGIPRAFEARLLPVPEGYFLPSESESSAVSLRTEHVTHAPSQTAFGLGPRPQAGQLVHLPSHLVADGLKPTGAAALRWRTVHTVVGDEASASLVIRVSSPAGVAPYPVGQITLRGEGVSLVNPSASWCGPQGDGAELALVGSPSPPSALSPLRAPRSPNDELCVRTTFAPRS